MLLIILALAFFAFFLLLLAIAKPKQKEDVETRLKRLSKDEAAAAPQPAKAEGAKKKASAADASARLDEIFLPLAQKNLGEKAAAELSKLLGDAGLYTTTALQLRASQYKSAGIALIAGGLFFITMFGFSPVFSPLLLAGLAVGGYHFPVIKLRQAITDRREAIVRQLPSTLDLLTICVEAGLSLQAALVKVVEKSRPSPLRDELDQVLREIQLGRPRAEALKEMAKRINLKEVSSVVVSMVQAEAMGTSVAKALRVQSEIARENRWSRAQEKAFKAPVKLTFPLIFFIFPTVFVVIFGPIVLELLTNFMAGK